MVRLFATPFRPVLPTFEDVAVFGRLGNFTFSRKQDYFEKGAPLTEFHQPLQVQSHLEMPGILVQLGHIQCT